MTEAPRLPGSNVNLPNLQQMQTSAIALLLAPLLGTLWHRYTGLALSNEESGLLAMGLLGFLHWVAIRIDQRFPAPSAAAPPTSAPPAA